MHFFRYLVYWKLELSVMFVFGITSDKFIKTAWNHDYPFPIYFLVLHNKFFFGWIFNVVYFYIEYIIHWNICFTVVFSISIGFLCFDYYYVYCTSNHVFLLVLLPLQVNSSFPIFNIFRAFVTIFVYCKHKWTIYHFYFYNFTLIFFISNTPWYNITA